MGNMFNPDVMKEADKEVEEINKQVKGSFTDKSTSQDGNERKNVKIKEPPRSKMDELQNLLNKYGDVPQSVVKKATSKDTRDNWLVAMKDGEIVGGGRTKKTDWYEMTLKNAFVVPEAREEGVATRLYKQLTDKAEEEGAKVAEADITSDNVSSKLPAVRAGMEPVNSFKWDEDKPPADIYQEVFKPPSVEETAKINRKIKKGFRERKKKMPEGVLSLGAKNEG